jgi:hypothetical protein
VPFFPKSAEKVLIRDRDNAVANVARLAAKLHDAEASVIASKSAVQRAALDGDDSTSMLPKPLSTARCAA